MRPMTVDLGIWDRISRLIVFLLVAAAVVGVVYCYVPGARKNEMKRSEIHRREAEIRAALQLSNQLQGQIKSMLTDDLALERAAREILRLSRSNELVIRFEEPVTNAGEASVGLGR